MPVILGLFGFGGGELILILILVAALIFLIRRIMREMFSSRLRSNRK